VTSFGSLKEAMMSDPISFLEQIFEAHGGLDQWRRFSKVEADVVTGGGLIRPLFLLRQTDRQKRAKHSTLCSQ